MGKRQHAVHPGVSHRSGRQLISKGQHHEGRMICQSQNHLLQFSQMIGVAFRRFKGVHRIPVGNDSGCISMPIRSAAMNAASGGRCGMEKRMQLIP